MRSAIVVAAGLAALGLVAGAAAHAEPARATPGDGAVLVAPPREVVLVMTQDMARQAGANAIDVFNAEGVEVTQEEAHIDPSDRRRLSVALPADLAPGDYVVRWKTLSADDGDSATGELRFRIDPTATPTPGKEVLKTSLLGPERSPSVVGSLPLAARQNERGTGWVLAAALGVVGLVLGTFAGVMLSRRGE